MKRSHLPFLSLRFYWRTNLAVALGMAVGTAVLVGALMVGDSVRGSLRRMTLDRLGKVDHALVANRFFTEALAGRMASAPEFQKSFESATPIILLTGSIERADSSSRARGINIIGAGAEFWSLGPADRGARPAPLKLEDRDIGLNARLAREIGAKAGDAVILRLDKPDPIPAEAVAGRRSGTIVSIRLTVANVLGEDGLARFGITPSQQLPFNAYVPLDTLQHSLDQPTMVNALLVAAKPGFEKASGAAALESIVSEKADMADLGLRVRKNAAPPYISIESTRMVLSETDADAAKSAAAQLGLESSPTLTYLANSIATSEREIPYSIVSALDPAVAPPLGPFKLVGGAPAPALGEHDILLNEWAAKDLGAKGGDSIRLTYYVTGAFGEFETSHADDFVMRGVVALEGAARDPGLTPAYPGIQNAANIRDWNPPFPVDLRKVRPIDEQYWKEYRTTPKGFISLATGLKLWTSRFGRLTSYRLGPAPGKTLDETAPLVEAQLRSRVSPESAGLIFQPVKAQGLEASQGASDFGMLFIMLSFFIIISAMLLVRLLFSLAVEQRSREVGFLLASGYTPRDLRRLFLTEGAVLALAGGVIGILLGIGYAALMLYGLRTWWVGSVGTTFLWLFVEPMSVAIGLLAGILGGMVSVFFAVRSMVGNTPSRLLSGRPEESSALTPPEVLARRRRRTQWAGNILAILTVGAIASSPFAPADEQAALFMTGGALLMAAALCYLSIALRARPRALARPGGFMPVALLGARNTSRNHGRSVLTAGLVASATFIIIAVGANRHGGGKEEIKRESGNGGFALMAESDVPLLHDLNTPQGREELNVPESAAPLFTESHVYPLRLNPGADASCLNLYRPRQPRILGATKAFIERGGFAFQSAAAQTPEDKANPWKLLDAAPEAGAIPAIGDYNTVMWILHSGVGKQIAIDDGSGKQVALKIVGLLAGSALQSELIISEQNFISLYPERSGYQVFLIESPEKDSAQMQQALESGLKEFGFDAFPTEERIESFRAVENTYLSTFQALGGLGLLLGTLGLGAVMLRNVLERRSELALLRSFGYRGSALATMVLAENGFLLLMGLGIGAGSALAAVAPNLREGAATMPWVSLGATLAAVFVLGMFSAGAAVYAAVRAPILSALRAT